MFKYDWMFPEYAWLCLIMREYAEIYVNMPKSAWMTFVLHFHILMCGYLFQRVHETRSYGLKEHEAVFWWDKIWCSLQWLELFDLILVLD